MGLTFGKAFYIDYRGDQAGELGGGFCGFVFQDSLVGEWFDLIKDFFVVEYTKPKLWEIMEMLKDVQCGFKAWFKTTVF